MSNDSKYCIGIDLGTTNSSLAYIDTESEEPKAVTMNIEQVTA